MNVAENLHGTGGTGITADLRTRSRDLPGEEGDAPTRMMHRTLLLRF